MAVYHAQLGEIAAARSSLAQFLDLRPGMTLRGIGDSLRFMEAELLARYLDGLAQGLNDAFSPCG